jgi:hypothetical protein
VLGGVERAADLGQDPLAHRQRYPEGEPCQNSHTSSELVLGSPAVLVNQAVGDVGALDPSGHIDWLARLVKRRSLFPRLVRPMFVVVPRVLCQHPPEVSFAVDKQVVKALAAQRSHISFRIRVRPG